MTLQLHIGSHKTGTTAIQDFASMYRDWLFERGILYPSFDLIGGKRARSHLTLVTMLAEAKSGEVTDAHRMLSRAAALAADEGKDVLLSAESLFRLQKDTAQRVCEVLREVFSATDIAVVCALRPQAEFAESLYRNGYRAYARPPEPFDRWIEKSARFEYARIVSVYLKELRAKPRLLPYSRKTRNDFVKTFFALFGIPIENSGMNAREKNPSLDAVDCLAKAIVMGDEAREQMSRAFNNFAFANRVSTDYAFLNSRRERAFLDKLGPGNAELIRIEPTLSSVLGPDVPLLGKTEIDGTCKEMAESRAAEFWARRT